jgi:hypothetical protein
MPVMLTEDELRPCIFAVIELHRTIQAKGQPDYIDIPHGYNWDEFRAAIAALNAVFDGDDWYDADSEPTSRNPTKIELLHRLDEAHATMEKLAQELTDAVNNLPDDEPEVKTFSYCEGCGRTLSDPVSVEEGLGLQCWWKLHDFLYVEALAEEPDLAAKVEIGEMDEFDAVGEFRRRDEARFLEVRRQSVIRIKAMSRHRGAAR